MTAQRLLKLLAILSIAATAAAAVLWQQTSQPPPPLLIKISAGAFAAALLVGLAGEETRPRIMLRFLAAVCALVAVIAFVTDFSRGGQGFTSLAGHLGQLAPSLLAALKAGAIRVGGQTGWEFSAQLLAMPTFLVFGLMAAVCGYASRRRDRLSIFVN